YTPKAHPALVAMRCVINKRPFKFSADLLHIEAVKLLRPGVIAPSTRTVSRDIDETY
ncbi:uncharacterized protein F5891DRAFT_935009, partial [Suillus fuscotomentosus]